MSLHERVSPKSMHLLVDDPTALGDQLASCPRVFLPSLPLSGWDMSHKKMATRNENYVCKQGVDAPPCPLQQAKNTRLDECWSCSTRGRMMRHNSSHKATHELLERACCQALSLFSRAWGGAECYAFPGLATRRVLWLIGRVPWQSLPLPPKNPTRGGSGLVQCEFSITCQHG